jgi:bifunctional non-homologous end joining protein LigD
VTSGEGIGRPEGVRLTNLDQPLFDGAGATKRDLVGYLEALCEQLLGELRDRPLSVIRALRGQEPFMQKNVPKYAPAWLRTVKMWAESSKREVAYALCNDRPTLLWFANQRAVEYHPTLFRLDPPDHPQTHLVLDIDPPAAAPFDAVVRTAELVRQALSEAGLAGAVKTSGAKGVHVFVPVAQPATSDAIAAATRALAARAERINPALATTAYVVADRDGKVFIDSTRGGGASIVAAYSPRIRPGTPVSFPVRWDELAGVAPTDFTIRTVPALVGTGNPWADRAGRGRPRDPGRPRRGDARGQAPGPRAAPPAGRRVTARGAPPPSLSRLARRAAGSRRRLGTRG